MHRVVYPGLPEEVKKLCQNQVLFDYQVFIGFLRNKSVRLRTLYGRLRTGGFDQYRIFFKEQGEMPQNLDNLVASICQYRVVNATGCVYADVRRHCMRPQNRINNPEKIDRLLIDKELKDGKLVIVQFSDKLYTDKILTDLNELCSEYNENFSVRFYGHYQGSFDCKTLLKLPNIKALWIDCLLKADNLEILTELKNLRRLSLGVFELKETEIFQANNLKNLKELIIG